jgi:cell division septation protein DedD
LAGGTEKSFAVSLDSTESEPFSYNSEPDFDISSTEMDTGSGSEKAAAPSYSPMNGHSAVIHEEKNRKPLLVAAILALLIAAGVLCWFFLLRDNDGENVAAVQPASPPPVVAPVQPVQPAPPPPPAPKPVTPPPAPAAQPQPAKPAPTPPPAAAKTPGTGVWYSIVKGDNLWNLSKSFYRNPWLYPKIAKENDIRNPDLIYRGNRIYIPDVETERKKR